MDIAAILARLDHERRFLQRDGEILESLPNVTRLRSADNSHHTVIHSTLEPHNADAIIAGQIEHFRGLGVGFEWKVFAHDPLPDLCRRLERHGFEIGQSESVLVHDLAKSPAWMTADPSRPVIRIKDASQITKYQRLAEAIFQKQYDFTVAELAAALHSGSDQHRGYISFAGDTPAGIGRLYTHPQSHFGGLYGGATLKEYRGQGVYRAMLAARARDAISLGARYLIVDALPTSRPILERIGFVRITETWPCNWEPELAR